MQRLHVSSVGYAWANGVIKHLGLITVISECLQNYKCYYKSNMIHDILLKYTSAVNKDLRHKPLSQTSRLNWHRRTVCDWLWLLVGSTNQPTTVIYFKQFNYGCLGLPWQPGVHYIFQPFALFVYLLFIFSYFNHGSRRPLGTALPNFRGKLCGGLE